MKKNLIYLACSICLFIFSCKQKTANSQQSGSAAKHSHVGDGCEGCEAVYESPVPFEKLNHIDTLPGFDDDGPKLLVEGIVYKADGKTPASGVVLYVYHTNRKGIYESRSTDRGWAKRHGYRRGWVKTNEQGMYQFYTVRPAPYPDAKFEAHIHPVIKEPNLNEYWIDEYVFDDDPLLTEKARSGLQHRGGSGILKPQNVNGMQVAKRDIILGMNIPNYPK